MIGAAGQVLGGLTGIASGIIGGGKRRAEQRAAQKEFDINKARYENLDTSNLAANMENTYEDLTVNTQAADFQAQQQQQALANTMSSMQGAAGGSGIAALAQAMAGQQSQNLQAASASIGQQEAKNQQLALGQQAQLQQMEARGERETQNLEKDKIETLFGMAQQRKISADAARQRATDQMVSGIGSLAGGVAGGIMTGVGNKQAGRGFFEMPEQN